MYLGGGWQARPCSSPQGQAPGSNLKPPIPLPPPQLPVPPFTLILKAAAVCPCPDKSYLWALHVLGLLPGQSSDRYWALNQGPLPASSPHQRHTIQNPLEKAQSRNKTNKQKIGNLRTKLFSRIPKAQNHRKGGLWQQEVGVGVVACIYSENPGGCSPNALHEPSSGVRPTSPPWAHMNLIYSPNPTTPHLP